MTKHPLLHRRILCLRVSLEQHSWDFHRLYAVTHHSGKMQKMHHKLRPQRNIRLCLDLTIAIRKYTLSLMA